MIRWRAAAAAVLLLCAAPAVGRCQESAPLTAAQLEALRGGFVVAGGFTVDFGAVLRTYIDGQLAYETQLSWSDLGAQVARTTGNGALKIDASALGAGVLGSLSAAGLPPGGVHNVVVANDGQTTLMQTVTAGQLSNVLLNSASGQSITQTTDVTLTLPGFAANQAAMNAAALRTNLAQALSDQLVAARR